MRTEPEVSVPKAMSAKPRDRYPKVELTLTSPMQEVSLTLSDADDGVEGGVWGTHAQRR